MDWGDLVLVLVVLNSITTMMPDMAAAQNPLLPFLPPVFSGACNRSVYCGRGSCQVSQENRFGFVCECDSGWSQIRNYSIFPCVIPNSNVACAYLSSTHGPLKGTINYSCANTSESQMASTMPTLTNISLYNPCSYSYCGGGSCVQTSSFNYRCNCNDGFHNLLNQSNYPCYRECSVGADCTNLGITLTNSSLVSPFSPYSPPSSSNNRDASSLSSFTPNILLLGIVVSAIPLVLAREV